MSGIGPISDHDYWKLASTPEDRDDEGFSNPRQDEYDDYYEEEDDGSA